MSDEDRSRTLTLRRDKSIAKDQKKLDEMKKKLHTDDECKLRYVTVYIVMMNISLLRCSIHTDDECKLRYVAVYKLVLNINVHLTFTMILKEYSSY